MIEYYTADYSTWTFGYCKSNIAIYTLQEDILFVTGFIVHAKERIFISAVIYHKRKCIFVLC